VTIAAQATPRSLPRGPMLALIAVILPFLLWQVGLWALGAPDLVAKGPAAVIDYLFLARSADSAQARLLAALAETLPITLVGMAAGLAFALAFAALGELAPALARTLLPVALVSQTMPLVALTPLLVLLLGRGEAVTLAITISVTFFPAYRHAGAGSRSSTPRSGRGPRRRLRGEPPGREMRLITLPGRRAATCLAADAAGDAAGAPRRDDRGMARHGPRPRQPAQPVARLSRLRHDLDRSRGVGPAVGAVLPGRGGRGAAGSAPARHGHRGVGARASAR
jgi:hypothetical protein